jgi:hypothetical protein
VSVLRVTHRTQRQDGQIRFERNHELSGIPKAGYIEFHAIHFHALNDNIRHNNKNTHNATHKFVLKILQLQHVPLFFLEQEGAGVLVV